MIKKAEYTLTSLEMLDLDADDILSGSYNNDIKERMIKIIETESPIKEKLLYKRVINSYSISKVGSRLLPLFSSISDTLDYEISIDSGEIVYHKNNKDVFRPTADSNIRYSYQIPAVEGANCILYILENSDKASYTKKEMKKLFALQMEYQKIGAQVDNLFKQSLKDPRIKISKNGRILKE